MSAPVVLAPALSVARPRLPLLDAARTFAAIGVIAAHVLDELFPQSRLKLVGTYAVPFYLFVALYFTVHGLTRDASRSIGTYVVGRVMKLYLPFLAWNAAYDVMHHVAHHGNSTQTPMTLLPWAAFYTHLYFLPFLLIVTVVTALIARPLSVRPTARRIVTVGLVIAGCLIGCGPQPTWLDDPMRIDHKTLWNAYKAIPAALFAMAFALNVGLRPTRFKTSGLVAIAGISLCVACVFIQYRFGPFPLLRSASGFGLAMAAFSTFDHPLLRPIAWAGRLSFGVYLSHVVFIRIAMAALGTHLVGAPVVGSIAVGAFAFVGGLAFSMAISRFAWTRWIIGCETDVQKPADRTAMPAVCPIARRPA